MQAFKLLVHTSVVMVNISNSMGYINEYNDTMHHDIEYIVTFVYVFLSILYWNGWMPISIQHVRYHMF